jgi:hypothetical protein
MYFNPSWSHAHAAFSVALFLWYWEKTRSARTFTQWMALGLAAGLMIDVYLPNGVFLLLPMVEALLRHLSLWKNEDKQSQYGLFLGGVAFVGAVWLALLPTLITRKIVYGGFFDVGVYSQLLWDWSAPHWWQVLFSSDHGALSWTPVLLLALIGFFVAPRSARVTAGYLGAGATVFYYVIASYPYWDGLSSYGNRFFISLTAIFIFGLALLFDRAATLFRDGGRAFVAVAGIVMVLTLWNMGLMFQWGEHLIPVRGEISFREVTHNQFFVVPKELSAHLQAYLFRRRSEMRKIEERDIEQLKAQPVP